MYISNLKCSTAIRTTLWGFSFSLSLIPSRDHHFTSIPLRQLYPFSHPFPSLSLLPRLTRNYPLESPPLPPFLFPSSPLPNTHSFFPLLNTLRSSILSLLIPLQPLSIFPFSPSPLSHHYPVLYLTIPSHYYLPPPPPLFSSPLPL